MAPVTYSESVVTEFRPSLDGSSLLPPDEQAVTARLAGAASLRRELEALLASAPRGASASDYRRLLIEENAAGKASANARMWMWKRLKLRYALDTPSSPEVVAFRATLGLATTPAERGLVEALMLARTDRLFREITLEVVSPHLKRPGAVVPFEAVREAVQRKAQAEGLHWSAKSVNNIANHVLTSLKDFGVLEGSRERRVTSVRITPPVALFAAQLGRAVGLTDRQNLDSAWFRLLGADATVAAEALRSAARSGLLEFRSQADVVELRLPDSRPSVEVA
jgi:hypothetical protein